MDVIKLNLLLLKCFALFIVVSQYHLVESTSQNQKYFKKVKSHGKYNLIMFIVWFAV